MGFSGVQTVPKSLQSVGIFMPLTVGIFMPLRMRGHSQPLTSDAWVAGMSKRFSASKAA